MVLSADSNAVRLAPLLLALLSACADPPPVTEFQVQLVAEGTGTVVGAAGALDCTLPSHAGTCRFELESGTEGMTITAIPAPGYLFTGWRPLGPFAPDGAVSVCVGATDPVCELPTGPGPFMLRPRFEHPGIVEVAIVGEGTVRSETHACGEDSGDQELCRRSFPAGTAVTLKASGDGFRGWADPCYERATTCTVAADSAVLMTAYFQQDPPITSQVLRVLGAGTGTGRVHSLDDGGAAIDCVVTEGVLTGRCAARTPVGASVRVAVTPDSGSRGYKIGPIDCGDGECTLTLDQDRSLAARFEADLIPVRLGINANAGHARFVSEPAGIDCASRGPGWLECEPVTFPFGEEFTIRAEMWGTTEIVPGSSYPWAPCATGVGQCLTIRPEDMHRPQVTLTGQTSQLEIIKGGDVYGGEIALRFEPMGYTRHISMEEISTIRLVSADVGAMVELTIPPSSTVTLLEWYNGCQGTGSCLVTMPTPEQWIRIGYRVGRVGG